MTDKVNEKQLSGEKNEQSDAQHLPLGREPKKWKKQHKTAQEYNIKQQPRVLRCVEAQQQVCKQWCNCLQVPCICFTDISKQATVDERILHQQTTHQHKIVMSAMCHRQITNNESAHHEDNLMTITYTYTTVFNSHFKDLIAMASCHIKD